MNAISMVSGEIADRVRGAAARGERLRITGGAGWLDAGRPVREATPLALSALTGIVEYVPGDLTLTALAATPLAEIERATAAERQFLALDPYGAPGATIGATIATASAGPLAHAFGTPRDIVLGVEAVTGEGTVIRAGGRVVKNVAGFDITRLLTGAWGTLGVITEVSVRLRALPETEESVAIAVRDDGTADCAALLTRVREAAVAPWCLELLSPALAARLGVASRTALIARLAGNEESVRAQFAALRALAPVARIADGVWRSLRECEPARAAVVRLSARPSRTAELWSAARGATASVSGAFVHASPGRGVVRLVLPDANAEKMTIVLDALAGLGARCIAERVPDSCWSHPMLASAVGDPLSRRAREAFDPRQILNPGILGDEE